MSQIRITHDAEADLRSTWSHLAADSRPAADRLLSAIVAKFATLARFPEMGSPCEEFTPGLRYSIVKRHVIIYRPMDDGGEIVRVVHGAQDLRSLLHPDL